MGRRKKDHIGRCLKPISRILFIHEDRVEWLSPQDVLMEAVGQKAFGLSAIPAAWTLPFFCISAELLVGFLVCGPAVVDKWMGSIGEGLNVIGLTQNDQVFVRSSGCGEDMNLRGALHTVHGDVVSIRGTIINCLTKLSRESASRTDRIPLLMQKACLPLRNLGHLSNERRCYEEHRDWIGEIESVDPDASAAFQINLRHWREQVAPDISKPLNCTLSSWISEVLKAPAEWAYSYRARVHFEWVWDGSVLYLVQADEEVDIDGRDPVAQFSQRKYRPVDFAPKVLRQITNSDAERFAKIKNVFIYNKVKLPIAPIYILNDVDAIARLSRGEVSKSLADDLEALVSGSLVIRMDLETQDLGKRQLLPRTQEVRNQHDAIEWLIKQSRLLCEMKEPGAFLFHNFIPAISSAFAYAAPGEPIVQIEGLWGLPEGLYYNTHDKFVVDTGTPKASSDRGAMGRYEVRIKTNFKRNYVAPADDGCWLTFSLCPPFDWRASLTEDECRYIAFNSRLIAEEQGFPVSIMWFVGVSPQIAPQPMIPWYHERFDPKVGQQTIVSRTKTKFDRCFVVRTAEDVDVLRNPTDDQLPPRRIRVQPQEEALLRDKNTLRNIGEAARKYNAVIVLEGAVLSHAYYQLVQTGAVVEVVHPFEGFDDRIVFNKLVRDKIPEIIKERGERVTIVALNPESHIKALREKLIEEAYELLDARDLTSVIAELADVETVVADLIKLYGISRKHLKQEIDAKRKQRGGFGKGIVLLETESVLPTSKGNEGGQMQLEGVDDGSLSMATVGSDELQRRTSLIDKRLDKHVSVGRVKITAAADINVTCRSWEMATKEESAGMGAQKLISGSVRGERDGTEWKIEVTVEIHDAPPELI